MRTQRRACRSRACPASTSPIPPSTPSSSRMVIATIGGLIPKLATKVPVIMGAATERIMQAAAPFVPDGFAPEAAEHLQDRHPLRVGQFTIRPFLVDHSGFDAYAMIVEAGGK